MTDYDISISKNVFNDVYVPFIGSEDYIQIYYGGAGSGKTIFVVQNAILKILGGGRNYLVTKKVASTIKASVFNEFIKGIRSWKLTDLFKINKSDKTITCINGYQILFAGLDDVEKLKGVTPENGVITDIVMEEATETSEDDLRQLKKRLRGGDGSIKKTITLMFNPILKTHWIYKRFFSGIGWTEDQTVHKSDGLSILKTTYKDNRFLTKQDVNELESEEDSYFYEVYTLGNWGVLGDLIFTNWHVDDLTEMIIDGSFNNPRFGGDFGYSSDPAAFVATHYDRTHKRIYIYDELYERGYTNDVLANAVIGMVGARTSTIWDSAEPKSIAELNQHGLTAYPAIKGKDSILYGIQWLRQYEIFVHKDCKNMINEFEQFQWAKDRNGNNLGRPVGINDHLIDALRYAYSNDMTAGTTAKITRYK